MRQNLQDAAMNDLLRLLRRGDPVIKAEPIAQCHRHTVSNVIQALRMCVDANGGQLIQMQVCARRVV